MADPRPVSVALVFAMCLPPSAAFWLTQHVELAEEPFVRENTLIDCSPTEVQIVVLNVLPLNDFNTFFPYVDIKTEKSRGSSKNLILYFDSSSQHKFEKPLQRSALVSMFSLLVFLFLPLLFFFQNQKTKD